MRNLLYEHLRRYRAPELATHSIHSKRNQRNPTVLLLILNRLLRWQIVSTFTSDPKGHTRFPSTEDIKGFGIRSTQVKLSDGAYYIEFEPAYFRPIPEKNLLRRYPTQEDQTVRPIPPSPAGFEKYFKKAVRHSKINTSNILEALYFWQGVAIRLYAEAQKDYQTHARAALRHVHSQLFAHRNLAGDVDIQSDANTFSLQDLSHWRREKNERIQAENGPIFKNIKYKEHWKIEQFFRSFDPDYPKPHIMCTMSSSVCLPHTDTEKGLSSAEIEAALHVMINRVMRVGFRNYSFLPLLIFSFLGEYHVRIIQATFDGLDFNLQYSESLNLHEIGEKSSIDLLIRYYKVPISCMFNDSEYCKLKLSPSKVA